MNFKIFFLLAFGMMLSTSHANNGVLEAQVIASIKNKQDTKLGCLVHPLEFRYYSESVIAPLSQDLVSRHGIYYADLKCSDLNMTYISGVVVMLSDGTIFHDDYLPQKNTSNCDSGSDF